MAKTEFLPNNSAYVAKFYPNQNFGSPSSLYFGQYLQPKDDYRTLLRFPLPFCPNRSIVSATLEFNISRNEIPSGVVVNAGLNQALQAWDQFHVRRGIMVRRIIGIIIIILITLTGMCWGQAKSDKQNSEVLRLHVLANSDETRDQALKLKVRDSILEYLSKEFSDAASAEQATKMAVERIPQIEEIAARVVENQGYAYPVIVKVGLYDFPTKAYGDLVLPQGEYQAVRVIIGEGKGQNWWCVLFPPLCLVSSSDQGLALTSADNAEIKWKVLELLKADSSIMIQ